MFDDGNQINDNVIGNNATILLTDNAQNTVNFLYINPIEFFNNGRASDIYLNFSTAGDESGIADEQNANPLSNQINQHSALETHNSGQDHQFNDNVINNNAAIILTDDAQNTVNFLYINPIEFFNNGRASDIYINISGDGAPATEAADLVGENLNEDTALQPETLNEEAPSTCSEPAAEVSAFEEQAFEFLDDFEFPDDFSFADAVEFVENFEFPDPLTLLDALGFSNEPVSDDDATSGILDALADKVGDAHEINDNVIGNNAAILLTDNAQNTVNFLYINPIQFFNDGRAGDIHLDITLGAGDEFFVL